MRLLANQHAKSLVLSVAQYLDFRRFRLQNCQPRSFVFMAVMCAWAWNANAASQNSDIQNTNLISKSTFVYLADASASHLLQPAGITYLPAGTRFIAFKQLADYQGSSRRLILTETGLWAYIIDKDSYYWNADHYDFFQQNKQPVIVRRTYVGTTSLGTTTGNGDDAAGTTRITITFTASEIYKKVSEDDNGPTVEIDLRKILNQNIQPAITLQVPIPRNHVAEPNLSSGLTIADIKPFEESNLNNGVRGIAKPCNTTEVQTINASGSAGVSVAAYFASLKLNAGIELQRVTKFGDESNVVRLYYTRSGVQGTYALTRKLACDGSVDRQYNFTNPSNLEVVIDAKFAAQQKLPIDGSTGQLLVSCPEQFFNIEDALLYLGFDQSEAAFIISRVAKFRDIGTTCAST